MNKNTKGTKKVVKKSLAQAAREWIAKKPTKELSSMTQGELCKLLNKGRKRKVGIGQFQQILKKEAEVRGFEIFYKTAE